MLKKVTVQVKDVNGNVKNKRVIIDDRGNEVSVDRIRGRVTEIDPSILEEPIMCSFDPSPLRAERAAMMGSHVAQRLEPEVKTDLTKPKFDPNSVAMDEGVLNPYTPTKLTDKHGSKGIISEVKGGTVYKETKLTIKDKHYVAHVDNLDEE